MRSRLGRSTDAAAQSPLEGVCGEAAARVDGSAAASPRPMTRSRGHPLLERSDRSQSDQLARGADQGSLNAVANERLGRLIGRRRAVILAEVRSRPSLDELACAADIAKSTASEHLTTLITTGLVERHRDGRLFRYQLTENGLALLELLGDRHPEGRFARLEE